MPKDDNYDIPLKDTHNLAEVTSFTSNTTKHGCLHNRGCKFSLERTKEKLDNFHAIKTSMPEWFDKWVPRLDICSLLIKDVNKTISPSLTFFGNYTHHHLRHIDAVGTRKTPQFRKFCPLEYFFRFQDLTGEVRDRCEKKFPGAQAWSSCHPQSVCQGLLFWIKFTLTKWGGPVEDEIGRPDPNEHDGDGRCSGKWAAVSDQVKYQNSKAISGCADGLDPTWKASPHRTLYGADKGKITVRGLVQLQDMEGLRAQHISLFTNITTIKKLMKVSCIGDCISPSDNSPGVSSDHTCLTNPSSFWKL